MARFVQKKEKMSMNMQNVYITQPKRCVSFISEMLLAPIEGKICI